MKKIIGLFGVTIYGFFCLLTLCLNGCLTSAGGQDAAKLLSAHVTIVAEKGKRFADARDELAKARLRNLQMLENSLVEIEEENAIDLYAWRVVGAKFRMDLYEGIMVATNDESNRHLLRKQRRERQEKELAKRKSAVKFKQSEMIESAKKLTLLAEEKSLRDEIDRLRDFTQEVLAEIEMESEDGKSNVEEGKNLAVKIETNISKIDLKEKKRKIEIQ